MTNKERYRGLCESEGSAIPVFQQYWWMEAVCADKQWDVALAADGNRILAAMPYMLRSRCGMRYIIQPQLTQFSGPCFFPPADMAERRLADFRYAACNQLIDQIEDLRFDYFCQRFSPVVTDWLPFHWRGYKQTTRYTYRIDDIADTERVFGNFDRGKERQRRIRRIADNYEVDTAVNVDEFVRLHIDYWRSRGEKDTLSEDFMRRVITAASDRGQGLTLGLRDGDGRLVAAWFAVYDDRCAHALLSAKAPDVTQADVSALLVWRLIEALSLRTKAFDFEGSMEQSLAYFYSSFGARQVPLFEVSRVRNPLFNVALRIKK